MSEKEFNIMFSENLNHFLSLRDKTQADLAKYIGVSTAAVNTWCKGLKTPRMDKVDKICLFLNINRSDLIEDKSQQTTSVAPARKGVTINVLGRVAAGIPIEAVEEIIDTEEITEDMAKTGKYFGLRISGNSMEPIINDGDIVIVRQQNDAESDEIVIALVNGNDGVCKRLIKYADSISLVSANPTYAPMYFKHDEIESKPVRIIGKVVELRRKF